ncbi:long-chain-fatty-acid--CoA ligase [Desulfallas sp. Bu1-1]|uniref:class I adenylate-forming enzyme family protein n=1 Tax=Desulfallas sp. Bu1-1 TaxID=2787620 RepID=UPI0018A0B1E6|nr:long-chain-fatty-acid--CoA ligase [Desulfallas sp. Bu1-1]MBF7084303.1 long-chain-fatty-acid--CoA ligase [Desulfallas sp. Bu1-1]
MKITLSYILERAASKYPKKIAIIYENRKFTYQKLNGNADRLANALLSMGIHKGDKVGVLLYNCPEFLECVFGVARAGGVLIPLNYRLKPAELEYILNQSGTKFLIHDAEFSVTIETLLTKTKLEKCIAVGQDPNQNYTFLLNESLPQRSPINLDDDDISMIMYTSGTTGKPKGAVLTHKAQIFSCINIMTTFNYVSEDIALTPSPMFHTAALHRSLAVVFVGATNIIMNKYRPNQFLELIEKEKVTLTVLIPTMFTMLKDVPHYKKYDVSSLKKLTMGAATVPVELLKEASDLFAEAQLWNGYGLTECSTATGLKVNDFPTKMDSVGKPHVNVEVRIMNENGLELPCGEVGEICLRAPNVMKEYYDDRQATKEAFWGDWLRTGDLGKLDEDGFLYFVDRKKDMIISGGENVYCKEVEDVLYTHPKVLEAAVIGIEDNFWGEIVGAVVVPRPETNLTEKEVIEFCAEKLAGYKKPKVVFFVNELPKSASNKILKRELKERFGKIKYIQ